MVTNMTGNWYYDLYLLDMDGTIYFEDKLIEGAKSFIDKLIENNINYVFVSNNSSINKNVYLDKLKKLDIKCEEENIFSSSMAMGLYLQENYKGKNVYLVGTKSFEQELLANGVQLVDDNADIVVVGYDRELTYQKLIKACEFLDNGAIFLATNPDLVYPLKNKRYLPDCGSICEMITHATGKFPTYIGKPNKYMVDVLAKRFNVQRDKMVIVGDRLYTDIQTAINANIDSVLVLTGETNIDMLQKSTIKPTYVVDSIGEINKKF